MRPTCVLAAALLATTALQGGVVAAQPPGAGMLSTNEPVGTWGILPGFDYLSGRYGTPDRTVSRILSLTVLYDRPAYTLTLTLPYIWQGGPSNNTLVRTAAGTVIVPANQPLSPALQAAAISVAPEARNVNGQGDIVAGATRFFGGAKEGAAVYSLGAQYKLHTANADKGLGTGKDDYSLLGGVSRKFRAGWSLSGTLGYTHYGSPAGISLRNGYWTVLAADDSLGSRSAVGATLFSGQKGLSNGSANHGQDTAPRLTGNRSGMCRALQFI